MSAPKKAGAASDTSGMAVDASGAVAYDPSRNVLDLVDAAATRQDDLRVKDKEISDIQHRHRAEIALLRAEHQTAIGTLREEYQEKIARAESGRLDSIRQVDREEVAKTAVAANTAITTLAKQTTDLSTTLAKQVADTAAAAEARNSAQYSDTNKRLSALELSSSEGKGKQTIADPALVQLAKDVENLARTQAMGTGKSQGLSMAWAILIAAVVLIGGLLTLRDRTAAAPPQVIYTPSPAGTLLPSAPPGQVAR